MEEREKRGGEIEREYAGLDTQSQQSSGTKMQSIQQHLSMWVSEKSLGHEPGHLSVHALGCLSVPPSFAPSLTQPAREHTVNVYRDIWPLNVSCANHFGSFLKIYCGREGHESRESACLIKSGGPVWAGVMRTRRRYADRWQLIC